MGSVPDIEGPRDLGAGIPGQPPDLVRPPSGCRFHPRCDRAMDVCVDAFPAYRSFAPAHAVACWAVDDTGRLRAQSELPVLDSARAITAARRVGAEVPVEIHEHGEHGASPSESGAEPPEAAA